MDIRLLAPTDGDAYRSIRLAALQEAPEAFGSTYEEDVELTSDTWARRIERASTPVRRCTFGAFDGDELVGIVSCVQEGKIKTRHKAAVLGMYVTPGARGRGVGRDLIARVIAEARTWGEVERLTLSVVAANRTAARLYEEAGFVTYGREPDAQRQSGDSHIVEYMTLALVT